MNMKDLFEKYSNKTVLDVFMHNLAEEDRKGGKVLSEEQEKAKAKSRLRKAQ